MAMNETYHSLLIDYASGSLDEAHSLLVAAHIALSPNARRIVQEYESIAGGLLHECCAPVSMCEEALQSVQTKYLLADISLAVGIGGLLAGGYFLLTDDEPPAETARGFPIEVTVGPRGGVATMSGKF